MAGGGGGISVHGTSLCCHQAARYGLLWQPLAPLQPLP